MVPRATVLLKGTTIGTSTGIDGEFVFPQKLVAGDVLIVSDLGYQPIWHIVKEQEGQSSRFQYVEMAFEYNDFELMSDINIDHIYDILPSVF